MSTTALDIITSYFAEDAKRDTEALVALFTDDAVVVDEGQTRRGVREIHAWRDGVASAYQYTTKVLGVEATGGGNYLALAHLEGNFPGEAVDLKHHFTIDGDRISRLEITP
jgi:ketosteroid isomerase-like protein